MVKINVSEIKLIKKEENIETYEGNMKILFKKIKKKYENDLFYYKSLLLNNNKVYDILEENNNIYIYYDSNENIDELLNIKENKECIIKGKCEPITKNEIYELFKKEDAMCKIKSQKIINDKLIRIVGTGFFFRIRYKRYSF